MKAWLEHVAFLQTWNYNRYEVRCGREECSNFPTCTCFPSNVRTVHLQHHLLAKYMDLS